MQLAFQVLFEVELFLVMAGLLLFPLLLIMHFLMPKRVLQTFFCPPYFSQVEIQMLSGLPFAFMRVSGFVSVIAFPQFGRKRGIMEMQSICPSWYVSLCRAFVVWFSIHFSLILLLLVFAVIYGAFL